MWCVWQPIGPPSTAPNYSPNLPAPLRPGWAYIPLYEPNGSPPTTQGPNQAGLSCAHATVHLLRPDLELDRICFRGYVVQIFRGIFLARGMELPMRTFSNWYPKADSTPHSFNTRAVNMDPCQQPFGVLHF